MRGGGVRHAAAKVTRLSYTLDYTRLLHYTTLQSENSTLHYTRHALNMGMVKRNLAFKCDQTLVTILFFTFSSISFRCNFMNRWILEQCCRLYMRSIRDQIDPKHSMLKPVDVLAMIFAFTVPAKSNELK